MKALNEISNLIESTSDDRELGEKVRQHFVKLESDSHKFVICIHCGTWQPVTRLNCRFCNKSLDEHN